MGKYDDIINLPHYEPKNHKRMAMGNRAAQFRPFAALTGYGDAIDEAARLTENKIDLDADAIEILDRKLMEISTNILMQPLVKITFFIPDTMKKGGQYVTITERIVRINEHEKTIKTDTGLIIPVVQLLDIETIK